MRKIVILTTDTLHHRFFINYLSEEIDFSLILLEEHSSNPSFPVGPLFDDDEYLYELHNFFKTISNSLPQKNIKNVESVNNENSIKFLNDLKPDFGVVFGTGKISEEVISLFKDGLINVHRGIAEKYRGLDSDLWAIYHGDFANIGVTIHQVLPELDSGDILFCKTLPIKAEMKIYEIRFNTTVIATKLVKKSLLMYLNETLNPVPQKKIGRYYSYMPLDLKRIVEKKFELYCESLK